jgi:hypothetical protein
MIFKMFLESKTFKNIIETLYEMGIKTSTGKDRWHKGTIDNMIRNHHEPIISTQTYEKVLALKESRQRNKSDGYIPYEKNSL